MKEKKHLQSVIINLEIMEEMNIEMKEIEIVLDK